MSAADFRPELLCPAGSPDAMRMAFAYGADAVYAGEPRYSLRVRNNSFTLENLGECINQAHQQGKRFYVVVNIAPHNAKLARFVEHICTIVAMKPDALIVSDPGVVMLLQQYFPRQPLHLSVQANTVNWAALQFWQQQGIERVILSRELGLKEIAEMRRQVPNMEVEVFVHGALCMAYSGRCLLSGYMNKRDPNQGACTNACRWGYEVHEAKENAVGQYEPVLLGDPKRPQDLMLLDEDIHGSYIMNSKDLRAVEYVQDLVEMGVHSLKIEGRTKSDYYIARTAQVYRRAIDDAVAGKPFNNELLSELEGMANRGFTAGFLQRHTPQDLQNYERSHSEGEHILVGQLMAEADNNLYQVEVKNGFSVGDELLLMTPKGNYPYQLARMESLKDEAMIRAPGSGYQVKVQTPVTLESSDIPFCFLIKAATVRKVA
ncbi:prephenate-dependent tRNA uridine(34) hydroxylase TrhP [Idiomarina aminovorans]|uniref:prephenate-dependent tRNA uridine(34) hydroxylase TrhP n=1 Tax=Idiomarina aminovorans TaxID=2914829 RepID=UPI002005D807|nr:tRNA 5-hydroxyuridine modification protein YegQ [Idiomarina sp. ATCH4]MCK7460404.1 tRNA 5-hydroxyuridine modification protein YegQ [Idiomarina sp. ATCH4]